MRNGYGFINRSDSNKESVLALQGVKNAGQLVLQTLVSTRAPPQTHSGLHPLHMLSACPRSPVRRSESVQVGREGQVQPPPTDPPAGDGSHLTPRPDPRPARETEASGADERGAGKLGRPETHTKMTWQRATIRLKIEGAQIRRDIEETRSAATAASEPLRLQGLTATPRGTQTT